MNNQVIENRRVDQKIMHLSIGWLHARMQACLNAFLDGLLYEREFGERDVFLFWGIRWRQIMLVARCWKKGWMKEWIGVDIGA